MPLTFGRDILNEGQFAQVVCIVTEGDEPLKITWSLQGETVSSEAGLSTTSLGTRTSMLTITVLSTVVTKSMKPAIVLVTYGTTSLFPFQ